MLLANWNELKSLDKQTSFKTRVWMYLSPLFLASNSAFAEAKTLSDTTSIVSIFLSLLLVIAVVFMLAFIMRRFNVTGGLFKDKLSLFMAGKLQPNANSGAKKGVGARDE